ncbi:glycoside hydrolase family 95 protein [Silvibacterium dinghuense]|uniref:Glycoside hydrolase family 95 protein n=2 Tax=Silvibacterium dinghuense TaxID=1560006 RepID=A0A4Q1SCT3_9BACT|nr:glycoside hydrolase family 95 protein [Silvibacterium dinghuense]
MTKLPSSLHGEQTQTGDVLWYSRPADTWLEAIPLGNGRLGAMVFGGMQRERIALSESTAWSGAAATGDVNPGAREHLEEIRRLLFAEKYDEAQVLSSKYLVGSMKNFGTNLPLPELLLEFESGAEVTEYQRSLRLNEAIAQVRWMAHGDRYEREAFASHADGVLIMRVSCNRKKRIGFRMHFGEGVLPGEVHAADGALRFTGHAWETLHSSGRDGVAVQIEARVLNDGGMVTAQANSLEVQGADEVTLLVAIGTSYGGANAGQMCRKILDASTVKSYSQLRKAHVSDYQPLYRRMAIDLGESTSAMRTMPIDQRRKAVEDGADDPELLALFFQYGRYLTIAGSREDSPLPLALQGIWNDGLASSMGWTDDFHLDINTEQNYWPAEVCNLSECQMPLFRLIDGMREHGHETAQGMYGAPGWVAHTVTNPWGYTAPGGTGWGIFVTAGVWISLQLWQHWSFGGDIVFLRTRAYPVLRDAAEFFLGYMVTEPKHGWLVTGPSESPENWYLTPTGGRASVSMGPTCDRVLIDALFRICIEASETLGVDEALRERLMSARRKLPPFQVGRHGQLQEWLEDFEEAYPNHRHTSHLIALYPENEISPRKTPELARAAEVTIERRIHAPHWEQSEWGRANLVVYYARLLKGDEARKYLIELISKSSASNLLTFSSGGVAGAEQDIFAIDGNTAGAAGIAEMLLQSQGGEIELLPALPVAWAKGSIRGLCARGSFVVDLAWERGQLREAMLFSQRGGKTQIRYGERVLSVEIAPGETRRMLARDFRA